ncbi:TnsA endonuclease N-terminal domain-containing protein [Sporosarcina sp. FSL K6-1522]|uniref:TnsA endonuclease N-terminal domain-containing protein n=1 Tax=Sporosarcina sp. FSL K6-1522 TaxID=2921554 RepID=UPI00315A0D42
MNNYIISKSHLNRLKDGRGQGRGREYVPFIQTNDNKVASEGWLTRTLGWKTGRIHHTLSKHEYQFLLVQEWSDNIVDIREQYPLTPIEMTMEIASKLNIRHPHLKGENVVMSTDFMLSVVNKDEDIIDVARTIKPVSRLTKRTLELFEIERRYFQEIGINWAMVFDKPKPINMIRNIDWMYDAKFLGSRPGIDLEMVDLVAGPLFNLLSSYSPKDSISKNCLKSDAELGLEAGTSLYIMQHMLVNKVWKTDMNQLIRENRPLILESNSPY